MNVYQKRNILLIGLVVWLLLAMLFGRVLPEEIALYTNLLLFGVWFMLTIKWWRCPYCLSYLGGFQFPTITCRCCGKDIPKNQHDSNSNLSNRANVLLFLTFIGMLLHSVALLQKRNFWQAKVPFYLFGCRVCISSAARLPIAFRKADDPIQDSTSQGQSRIPPNSLSHPFSKAISKISTAFACNSLSPV